MHRYVLESVDQPKSTFGRSPMIEQKTSKGELYLSYIQDLQFSFLENKKTKPPKHYRLYSYPQNVRFYTALQRLVESKDIPTGFALVSDFQCNSDGLHDSDISVEFGRYDYTPQDYFVDTPRIVVHNTPQ